MWRRETRVVVQIDLLMGRLGRLVGEELLDARERPRRLEQPRRNGRGRRLLRVVARRVHRVRAAHEAGGRAPKRLDAARRRPLHSRRLRQDRVAVFAVLVDHHETVLQALEPLRM